MKEYQSFVTIINQEECKELKEKIPHHKELIHSMSSIR